MKTLNVMRTLCALTGGIGLLTACANEAMPVKDENSSNGIAGAANMGAGGSAGAAGTGGKAGQAGQAGKSGAAGNAGNAAGAGASASGGTSAMGGASGASTTGGNGGSSATGGSSGQSGQSGAAGNSGSTSTGGSSAAGGNAGASGSGTSGAAGSGGNVGTGGSAGGTSGSSGASSGQAGQAGSSASAGSAGSPQCQQGTTASCTTVCMSTGTKGCQSNGTWSPCIPPIEVCNGKDDDCDGVIDNGVVCGEPICTPGQTGSCPTTCGSIGTLTCGPNGQWQGGCVPPAEICGNGKDDDCDGVIDNGCTPPLPGMSAIIYEYGTTDGSALAKSITVWDQALDGNGKPMARPMPYGNTVCDKSYDWCAATDGLNESCYTSLTNTIKCTVHRPHCATITTDAFVELVDPPQNTAFYTIDSPTCHVNGAYYTVTVDGAAPEITCIPWTISATQAYGRYVFKTPCP